MPRVRPRLRGLELVEEEEEEAGEGLLPHGETGEALVNAIPFQVGILDSLCLAISRFIYCPYRIAINENLTPPLNAVFRLLLVER